MYEKAMFFMLLFLVLLGIYSNFLKGKIKPLSETNKILVATLLVEIIKWLLDRLLFKISN